MKTKFFTFFAAFVLLFSAQASAQVNGDVNDDGKVNEQDIAAILEIMAEAGGVKEQTKYYWYVGQTNPASVSEIKSSDIVTDNSSPGWRLIGTTVPTYSASEMLWNSDNVIGLGAKVTWYLALPSKDIKVYSVGVDLTADLLNYNGTQIINGVEYHIYTSIGTIRNLGYDIY